ncbi:hypothetical protein [Bacillus stratosphericus]|uniref:hypothetical protein n=1 Tax=Bacillus stratosphericus TaxID=293386 RepID=UPI001CFC32BE|nr:hypothetical protein [Bacillus stratosphericus]
MEWQRCPRCNSNRVGKRGSAGCLSILLMLFISFFISYVATNFLFFSIFLLRIVLFVIIFIYLIKLREKIFGYLYCKDCELSFKPRRNSNGTVRSIAISLSKVDPANYMQLDLFKPDQEKVSRLGHVMDEINNKFGHTAIMRAASYTNAGTMIHRSNLVGGHMG